MALAFGTATITSPGHVTTQVTTLGDAVAIGDWVVVFVALSATGSNGNATPAVSSVTSSPALVWTKRKANSGQFTNITNVWEGVEEWWAPCTSTIGANGLAVTTNFNETLDSGDVFVAKVTGAPTGWDPNASLPATAQDLNAGSGVTPAATLSTTEPDTLVFALLGCGQNHTFGTPSGWTQLAQHSAAAAAGFNVATVVYKLFSAKQTNLTITDQNGSAAAWFLIADAITSDAITAATVPQINFCIPSG